MTNKEGRKEEIELGNHKAIVIKPKEKITFEEGDKRIEKIIKEWMVKNWNKRCKDYQEGCGTCDAWKCFDFIFHPEKFDNPIQKARLDERKRIIKTINKWKKNLEKAIYELEKQKQTPSTKLAISNLEGQRYMLHMIENEINKKEMEG